VPKSLKRGFFEGNEEIIWDNFSRLGNEVLRGVVRLDTGSIGNWEWEIGNRELGTDIWKQTTNNGK